MLKAKLTGKCLRALCSLRSSYAVCPMSPALWASSWLPSELSMTGNKALVLGIVPLRDAQNIPPSNNMQFCMS